jgi:6-pyruvoyltetrahydropterin/6-carboxytetrahydropterin synthase
MSKVTLVRIENFSASHRLVSEYLSEEENVALFGKCFLPNGHGHNYRLEVHVTGEIDRDTGIVMNLTDLKHLIQSEILDRVDHRHLNLDVPEFKSLNPSVENIAIVFWHWLKPKLPPSIQLEMRVHETDKNMAIYRGEAASWN